MDDAPRYRRDARLPSQEIQGCTVVIVPARRELHELDETATFLWSALARDQSVPELAQALCEEFEVDLETARKDAAEFIASLEERGLVVRA